MKWIALIILLLVAQAAYAGPPIVSVADLFDAVRELPQHKKDNIRESFASPAEGVNSNRDGSAVADALEIIGMLCTNRMSTFPAEKTP